MKECLDIFCDTSGQQVSFAKLRVFCSRNTNNKTAKDIATFYSSPLTDDLGKYLGVPIIHGRINKGTYKELLEKTQKRLASWKSATLSFAGRMTLIKSVTTSLPVYAMQTVKLPSDLCQKLDHLNRDLLWGHIKEQNVVHLMKWDTVCMPKNKGGLGIKKMELMNQTLLAKASWRNLQNESGLCGDLLRSKYVKKLSIIDVSEKNSGVCSSTWK
ncbi:hypothetical protein Ddye_012983 [Dipteronia dyeriana]|uniref:Uncharacterized protein n=1 Tax=Dipteronia dyeriana TaxID=168575 RepID=A0AAE0CJ63_9ROSI|nr:hypothetical protein Ddye_012983 [Dipteronia dyeriana]